MAAVFGIAIVIAACAALVFLAIALASALVGSAVGVLLVALAALVAWRIALRKKNAAHDFRP
jgi:hypothetical protein